MSLILDTLNKIKSSSKGKPVAPGLSKNKQNKPIKKYIFLGSLIIVLSAIAIFLYLYQNVFIYENTAPNYKNLTQKNKPIEETEKKQITQPKQQVLTKPEKKNLEKSHINKKTAISLLEKKPTLNAVSQQLEKKSVSNKKIDKNALYATYLAVANQALDEKNYKKSLRYYKLAYNINHSPKLLKNIILLQLETGSYQEALKYIEKIKDREYQSEILIRLIDNGNLETAEKFLRKNINTDRTGYIYYAYGYLEEKRGNYQKALDLYKKAYYLNKKDSYIAYAYARMLEITGNNLQAVKIYRAILENSKTDNSIKKIAEERIRLLGGLNE